MKCEKCGHDNNKYSVICEKCGAPLKIEENGFLQEKYHHKGKHIDIEEIVKVEKPDFNETKKKVSRTVIFFLVLFIASFLYLLMNLFLVKGSKETIEKYSNYFHHSPVAVFYFGTEEELDSKLTEYAETYEFDYLNIDARKLTRSRKKKMRKELNIYNMTSTLVVVQSGVPVATFNTTQGEEELLTFLRRQGLIPEKLEEAKVVTSSLETFKNAFSSTEPTLLYFPTKYQEDIEKRSETLKHISSQYGLSYQEVKGYLFSRRQLLRMMSQLGYSEIQKDLILYLRDGKVEKTIVDEEGKMDSYFEMLSFYGIIDTSGADYLKTITDTQFHSYLENKKNKYVILVGTKDCSYCDRVKPILGEIANQHQITIYYYDASSKINEVTSKMESMGVNASISTSPLLLVVEKAKILDYVVGLSTKDLYLEKLTELGVIR